MSILLNGTKPYWNNTWNRKNDSIQQKPSFGYTLFNWNKYTRAVIFVASISITANRFQALPEAATFRWWLERCTTEWTSLTPITLIISEHKEERKTHSCRIIVTGTFSYFFHLLPKRLAAYIYVTLNLQICAQTIKFVELHIDHVTRVHLRAVFDNIIFKLLHINWCKAISGEQQTINHWS